MLRQHAGQVPAQDRRPQPIEVALVRERGLEREPVDRPWDKAGVVDLGDGVAPEKDGTGQGVGVREMLVVRNHRGVDQRDVPNRGVDTAVGGQHAGEHEPAEGVSGEDVGRPVGAIPDPGESNCSDHRQAAGPDDYAHEMVANLARDDEEEAIEHHRALDMATRERSVFGVAADTDEYVQIGPGALDEELANDVVDDSTQREAQQRRERHPLAACRQQGNGSGPAGDRAGGSGE